MAHIDGTRPLDVCENFPAIELRTVRDGDVSLPGNFGPHWGVVLFYRGLWCGYCRRQLADFQANLAEIEALGARVVAASVDNRDEAETMASQIGAAFPIGYGVDARDIARKTGCFYEAADLFLQKCAFVLRPGGEVARSVYSTGPVGALTAADTVYSLKFFQKNPEHRVGKLRALGGGLA